MFSVVSRLSGPLPDPVAQFNSHTVVSEGPSVKSSHVHAYYCSSVFFLSSVGSLSLSEFS